MAATDLAYNSKELMVCLAARCLEDHSTVVVGTGAPLAAAMLAQRLHAPDLIVLFESGSIDPILPTMPISVGDSRTFWKAAIATTMDDIMSFSQRGMVDYTFLGGAQVDMYGNINSTMIGLDYESPKVRLPGSGGANDFGSLCWRTMTIAPHDRRRFVERCDFITTPGYLTGPGAREAAGLPPGTGPYKVFTDLCIIGFDDETKRMKVESLHPGIAKERVQENTDFELLWAENLDESHPPTGQELEMLREEVDPLHYIIGT